MDFRGRLYFSGVTKNALYTLNLFTEAKMEVRPGNLRIQLISQDNSSLIWPDTFSIDDDGDYLWTTTRGWPIDSRKNSIVRLYIGKKSYLYDN